MINQYRCDEGRVPVGRSTVINAFDRINLNITHTDKMFQGDNKNKKWRLAKRNQFKQNLIMRRPITKYQLFTKYNE